MAKTRKVLHIFIPLLLGLLLLAAAGVVFRFEWMRTAYKQIITWSIQVKATYNSYNLGASTPYTPVKSKISPADKMTQVYVPKGEFIMGSNDESMPKSYPEHIVYLSAYWMDQVEVTNGMFALCVEAGACRHLTYPEDKIHYLDNPSYKDYPVVYVTWFDAETYCQWAGRRLPTEAEWEKAARGTDGRLYPWGNTPPDSRLGNFDEIFDGPLPSNRYKLGASPFGVLNMVGNVREWVADWFNQSYYSRSPAANPKGAAAGEKRSLRGASYLDSGQQLFVFNRFEHQPGSQGINRGFRCAESEHQ
jgi:formylglycine-generating enzyme required for sulfatase activity